MDKGRRQKLNNSFKVAKQVGSRARNLLQSDNALSLKHRHRSLNCLSRCAEPAEFHTAPVSSNYSRCWLICAKRYKNPKPFTVQMLSTRCKWGQGFRIWVKSPPSTHPILSVDFQITHNPLTILDSSPKRQRLSRNHYAEILSVLSACMCAWL